MNQWVVAIFALALVICFFGALFYTVGWVIHKIDQLDNLL